jgi:8-oxo-dGTP pyrophosphatase MutT (NUDIX family)
MPGFIDKVAWTPVRSRAIPFVRSYGHDLFYSVGGKREPGESDAETLAREVREEMGVTVIGHTIRYIHTFEGRAYGMPEGTKLRIACYDAAVEGEARPSGEVTELAWFTTADGHRTTETGRDILAWHQARGLID